MLTGPGNEKRVQVLFGPFIRAKGDFGVVDGSARLDWLLSLGFQKNEKNGKKSNFRNHGFNWREVGAGAMPTGRFAMLRRYGVSLAP
jgi:hypothetical protein